ncbi:MAG TPA: DUF4864 domain-containing protein [Methylibium sp.]|nr:DUF4864 domain-containing protein [Methylibium sp.]
MRRWNILAKLGLVMSLSWALGLQAAPPAPDDALQAQQVIRAQLAAFAADDAETAFSHATPEVRQRFGSAERFVGMVRQGYPMVYRPASVAFMEAVDADGDVLQGVSIVDVSGRAWDVTYRLQRGADRRWRIAGCRAEPGSGLSI